MTTFELFPSTRLRRWLFPSNAALTPRNDERSISSEEIEWLPAINQAARHLDSMRPGWDGNDAPVPTATTIEIALYELARCVAPGMPPPEVRPTVRAGVQFEWHQGGWDIEMECLPSGRVVAWGEERLSREGWEGELPTVRENLILSLKRLPTWTRS